VLRAVAAAASPYLVTLYDVGQHDGMVYYAMQHLADGSLAAPARPLDQTAMVRSVADVARAAGALHAVGIVHRAVKPGNTLLTSYGAKLSDVDLSHAITPGLVTPGLVTTTGTPVAELELTDPDVLRGEPPAPRHDVWSIGAMLHRVVAGIGIYGELPAADGLGTVWSTLSAKPEISAALPGPIGEIVGDCLARGAQRPPATVVADRLAAAG
jgi:serine/threonine protein kinase